MHELLPLAEQLDRAAGELETDHPTHHRLALILIDNAVELMVRSALWVHVALVGDFHGLTHGQRRAARSNSLPERAGVLIAIGEMSRTDVDFMLAAHRHRNALYHEGQIERDFLRPLAFVYYAFAVDYLERFERACNSVALGFAFTPVSRRYYDVSREHHGTIDRAKLAAALRIRLPPQPGPPLAVTLADTAERERLGIARGYRFLIDHATGRSSARVLAQAQFGYAREHALERKGLEDSLFDTPRRRQAVSFANARHADFRPRYKAIPHGSWAQAIARIRTNPNPRSAMIRFDRLKTNMEFLAEAICQAVLRREAELDRD